ncbi:MAG: hypothetical protein AB8B58_18820 [Roseobacter sp.]
MFPSAQKILSKQGNFRMDVGRILILASAAAFLATDVAAATLGVKSFNIRNNNDKSWTGPGFDRRDMVLRDILTPVAGSSERAQIIGLQEVTPDQYDDIANDLAPLGYTFIGGPREPGGEAAPLFFDINRFTPVEGGQFNLSLTPGVPETRHILDGPSEPPRIATWAVLLDRETNQEIVAVNTHFQTRSQKDARGGETLENLQNKLSPDSFEGLQANLNFFRGLYT